VIGRRWNQRRSFSGATYTNTALSAAGAANIPPAPAAPAVYPTYPSAVYPNAVYSSAATADVAVASSALLPADVSFPPPPSYNDLIADD